MKRLVALVLSLALVAPVWGATPAGAPPFPFASTHQLTEKTPGIEAVGAQPAMCPGGAQAWELAYKIEGHDWIVYLAEARFVGVMYPLDPQPGDMPQWLYFGTYNTENARIAVQSVEAFDPSKHTLPCDWLILKPA